MTIELQRPQLPAPHESVKPQAPPLEEVLEMIRRDSRSAPLEYLDETVAKYGGE